MLEQKLLTYDANVPETREYTIAVLKCLVWYLTRSRQSSKVLVLFVSANY